ncbi:MAG: TIGR02206 family membrane protein [Flavobacteriales bacterium]|nr:TIGR02206 family membrane protein [Flavobacteriales bacterium]MBT5089583.1 TIGR02206 family membrane protein [Flavobacteriales bacterium]MBT5750100.1 TIGR02206 family membrane protein [Flavobacteriales bacterium]
MHEIIEPFSPLWWQGIVGCFVVVSLILLFFNRASSEWKLWFTKLLAYSSILVYMVTHIVAIASKEWNIQDFLPLHLCTISFFICIIVLLTKKQWMYEWVILLAMSSGLHSVLTPELSRGISNWYLFEYYFVHCSLMLVPLYLTLVLDMRPRVASWWKTFLRLQIAVVIVFSFNFFFDTNYMYLTTKPLVDNPLLIGDWPFYIFFLELFVLLHILVIYKLLPKHI